MKVKIGQYYYNVEYVKNTGPNTSGYILYEKGIIRIKNTKTKEQQEETLIHEMIHGLIDYYMLGNYLRDEEMFVSIISKGLHQLLKDNK